MQLRDLVAELVAVESVNPTLGDGGSGEAAIAQAVADSLRAERVEPAVTEVAPGRPNVTASVGAGEGPALLLLAHTDTVGLGTGDRGRAEPVADGDRLWGRGGYDMKAGLAAAMCALLELRDVAGTVMLAAVCDEEAGGLGTRALIASGLAADAAIVPEPTDLELCIAHRGFVGFEIETRGRAAHGSRPDLGEDAILAMGPILTELAALDARLQAGRRHPAMGSASLHAGVIAGGREFSTYPESCVVTGEWRTLPGDEPERELEALIARTGARAELRRQHVGIPLDVAPDEPIVRLLGEHAGRTPTGIGFWTDAALLADAGIPAILYGPSGGGAHAAEEWVDLPSAEHVRDVLVRTARAFCAGS